jgi:hypothetical protein
MEKLPDYNSELIALFKRETAEGKNQAYMVTIARDGESPVRSIYRFDNAVDAAAGYAAYTDWGFAKDYLTVELYEPTGRVHTKVLRRPRGGECVFVRQDYHEATEIIKNLKDKVSGEAYDYLVREFGKLFSKDNQRFDYERFVQSLDSDASLED